MNLTERLLKITEKVNNCSVLADIGTDHAYIPIYCTENSKAKYCIACDIREGPLKIAERNILSHNLGEKIETRLCDGLSGLKKDEADVIVIAGMGGQLICDIIKNGADKISNDCILILQPMLAEKEVRKFLFENRFTIIGESLAKEGNKIYNIIEAKRGKADYDEFDILIGRKLYESADVYFADYMTKKIKISEKIINGKKKANSKEDIEEYEKEFSLYKSVLGEYLRTKQKIY